MEIKNLNVYFFLAILLAVSAITFIILKPFLVMIILAAILAVVFRKPYEFFLRLTRQRKEISSLMTCFLVILIIVIPVISVLGMVANEASDFYRENLSDKEKIGGYMENVAGSVSSLPIINQFDFNLEEFFSRDEFINSLRNTGQWVLIIGQRTYQAVAAFGFWSFILFFTLFYLFIDGKDMVKRIMYLSPLRDGQEKILIDKFISISRATLNSTIIIGVIQGLIGGATFALAGVPSAVLWGVVMAIISIIPMIGPVLVWAPIGVFMLITGNYLAGLIILGVGFGIISTIDNILRPKLVGRDTQMHPLMVLFSTLGGIFVFGIAGFIIGPIIAALFIALWDIYGTEFKSQLEKYNI